MKKVFHLYHTFDVENCLKFLFAYWNAQYHLSLIDTSFNKRMHVMKKITDLHVLYVKTWKSNATFLCESWFWRKSWSQELIFGIILKMMFFWYLSRKSIHEMRNIWQFHKIHSILIDIAISLLHKQPIFPMISISITYGIELQRLRFFWKHKMQQNLR